MLAGVRSSKRARPPSRAARRSPRRSAPTLRRRTGRPRPPRRDHQIGLVAQRCGRGDALWPPAAVCRRSQCCSSSDWAAGSEVQIVVPRSDAATTAGRAPRPRAARRRARAAGARGTAPGRGGLRRSRRSFRACCAAGLPARRAAFTSAPRRASSTPTWTPTIPAPTTATRISLASVYGGIPRRERPAVAGHPDKWRRAISPCPGALDPADAAWLDKSDTERGTASRHACISCIT